MPHRSDLDAALTRANALQRELEKAEEERADDEAEIEALKKQLAEARVELDKQEKTESRAKKKEEKKEKRQRKKTQRASTASDSPKKTWPKVIAAVAIVGGLVGAFVLIGRSCSDRKDRNAPGKLRQVLPLPDQAMLLVDSVFHSGKGSYYSYRLNRVSLKDGRRTARVILKKVDSVRVSPALLAKGRFWLFYSKKRKRRFEVRDIETLATVLPHEKLVAAAGAKIHRVGGVDVNTGALLITTVNGDRLSIDPLRGTADDTPAGRTSSYRTSRQKTSYRAVIGGMTYRFASENGSMRTQLFSSHGRERTPSGGDKLLHPSFLADLRTRVGLTLPKEGGFIVCHRSRLDSPRDQSTISGMGRDGKLTWTLENAKGSCGGGLVADDGTVVVIVYGGRKEPSRAISLDWKTGKERWRYPR